MPNSDMPSRVHSPDAINSQIAAYLYACAIAKVMGTYQQQLNNRFTTQPHMS